MDSAILFRPPREREGKEAARGNFVVNFGEFMPEEIYIYISLFFKL